MQKHSFFKRLTLLSVGAGLTMVAFFVLRGPFIQLFGLDPSYAYAEMPLLIAAIALVGVLFFLLFTRTDSIVRRVVISVIALVVFIFATQFLGYLHVRGLGGSLITNMTIGHIVTVVEAMMMFAVTGYSVGTLAKST